MPLVLDWSAIFSNARSNCFLRRWRVRGGRGWSYRRVSIRSVWPAALSSLDDKSMGCSSCTLTGQGGSHSASPLLSTPVCYPLQWRRYLWGTGVGAPSSFRIYFSHVLKAVYQICRFSRLEYRTFNLLKIRTRVTASRKYMAILGVKSVVFKRYYRPFQLDLWVAW